MTDYSNGSGNNTTTPSCETLPTAGQATSLPRDHFRLYQIDDLKPLSLNHAYQTFQAKNKNPGAKGGWKNKVWRKKTDEAEMYQFMIMDTLGYLDLTKYQDTKFPVPAPAVGQGVGLSMVFCFPPKDLRTNDKQKFRRFDVSNCVKLVEDAVFDYLGYDDSLNLDPAPHKRESWDERWHILIGLYRVHIRSHVPMIDMTPYYAPLLENLVVDTVRQ